MNVIRPELFGSMNSTRYSKELLYKKAKTYIIGAIVDFKPIKSLKYDFKYDFKSTIIMIDRQNTSKILN